MEFNKSEIKTADAALSEMKDAEKMADGHKVRQAMKKFGDPYKMMEVMKNDLHLIVARGDSLALTKEGRKAAAMGFSNYLRYLDFKEWLMFWGPVLSAVAAVVSIVGAVISWLG